MKKTLLYLFISIFCFLSFTEAKGQFTNPFEEFISTFNDGATLNGRVYLDINGNGIQDANEPGIEDVIIILINNNNNAQSTFTDENGNWTLNVPSGNTIVFIANNTLPPGAVLTQGTVPSIFEVDPGEVFDVEHFGYFQVGTIQGNIYLDINGNGTQDPDENGISGVEVFVTDEYGNAQTVTTNNEGFWQAVVGTGNVTSDINQDGPNFPTGAIQTEGTDPSITFIPPGQVTFSENDGFYPAGTIEGTLYFDSNGNGTQDAGENGITNVTIEALDELGNINTTVTDENGSWSFILPEGEATVTIDEFQDNFPTGATQTEGTNPTNYTIINAESYSQTDGFFEFGIIEGIVYLDQNSNGTQDAGENGIPNLILDITTEVGVSLQVTTDTNGEWSAEVPLGNTIISIDETQNVLPTYPFQTEGTNPTVYQVLINETYSQVDGFTPGGLLEGLIYLDSNNNGQQDSGEEGISNIEVSFENSLGGTTLATTNQNGIWEVILPIGDAVSFIDITQPNFPANAIQTEGTNPTTTLIEEDLVSNEVNGFFAPEEENSTITGRVYLDINGNGTQDTNEVGIADVEIFIEEANGNNFSVTTDINGDFSAEVEAGEVTYEINTNDPNFPENAIQTEGTNPTTITAVENETTFGGNNGFFVPDSDLDGILTGLVYLDANGNGTLDPGEEGIANVVVEFIDANGVSSSTVTDLNGIFTTQIEEGLILIEVNENLPDFPIGATQTDGTNPVLFNAIGGQINTTPNFGYFESSSETSTITGRVYLDINGNGTQDTNEVGIADVEIFIEEANGNNFSVTTDINGDFSAEVEAGEVTYEINTNDPNFPENAIQTEGTNPTTITAVENETTFGGNNGFFVPDSDLDGILTGLVYLDANGNGTLDPGEEGIANVVVQFIDSNGNFTTTETNQNGIFSTQIEEGFLLVEINENLPDFPIGAIQTDGNNPILFNATGGQINITPNFGYFIPNEDNNATLEGLVYLDENGNGTQDDGEVGISNVEVQIEDSLGNVISIFTNNEGIFTTEVAAGDCSVTINENDPNIPDGAIQTEGTNPTNLFAVANEVNNAGINGYFVPDGETDTFISGRVYLDTNGNGTQDTGEIGIDNVEIVITEESGNSFSVFTNNDGDFSAQVVTGNISYEINTNDPNFPENTIQTEGTNPTTVNALPNVNTFGGNNGFFVPSDDLESLINGRVYFDANGNGIQDDEEEGIADIPINIIDGLGNEITVNTDANGDFQASVVAGNIFYEIDEESPNFPTGATQTEGTNPTTVFVAPNTNTFVGNNGFFIPTTPPEPANLISRWYVDSNGNGSLDPGEPFLSGLDVTVTDSFGNTQTVVVNAQGFTVAEIFAGNVTFEIDETQPGFPEAAIQTEGTNPTTVFVSPNTTLYTGNNGFFVPSNEITIDLNGIVYFDANGNGTQDDDEEGITNVEVEIIDGIGVQWQVFTDEDGVFSVTVAAGEINVLVDENSPEIPVGSVLTEGTNPLETLIFPVDNPFIGSYGFFTPEETETTISGIVYFDENGNGIQDDEEPGLEEISVDIIDGEGNLIVVTTNEEGIFSAEVQIGNIVIDVDESSPNFPQGAVQTEGVNPLEININMESDSFIGSFGYFVPVIERTISGLVYLDQNGNGQQDAGEPGIENIPIEIIDGGGNLVGAITVQDGFFSVAVQIGDISILVDESDVNFPQGAVQTEGQNPLEISINEDDDAFVGNFGYFVDDTEEPEDGIRIFNAVSPNGSGQNQFFRIEGLSAVSNTNVQIFNREGVKVYDVDNYGFGSNLFRGVSEGRITFQRNKLLPTGTYFYLLRYTDEDGVRQKKQGYLYLIN